MERAPRWSVARRAALLALALCAEPRAAQLAAQTVSFGRPLFELQTEHIAIYYPAQLRDEAGRLASFAEEAFARLSRRFPDGAAQAGRIPVLLADGQAGINGYFTPYPSNRIVIFAAPAELGSELGCLDDDLRGVFYHELGHALSFSTRSPYWRFWAGLLGDPVEPTLWTAGPALAEGAAVLGEGSPATEEGRSAGRATDPLANTQLRQDIVEGRFKDYWQASGAWDAFPYGELPYDYGARFVADLVKERGDEAFAALWRGLGEGDLLAGMDGGLFLRGAFERVYGERLEDAWREFGASEAIREPIVAATERLYPRPGYITAIAAGRDRVYWADASRGELFALDTATGAVAAVARVDGSVGRIDPSPDGDRLLLSFVRVVEGRELPTVAVWDLARRRFVGPMLSGLREAAYARGADPQALLAIAADGFRADLVLVSGTRRQVLLRGGPERSYGSPASPDGRRVYCLARDRGKTLLLRLDIAGGDAAGAPSAEGSAVPSPPGTPPATATLLPGLSLDNLRSLALAPAAPGSGPRLALSFAEERGLYRLALLEDAEPTAGGETAAAVALQRQETMLSGSVLSPALAGDGRVYYIARFSEGEYPCRYPSDNPALALRDDGASWARLDPSFLAPKDEMPDAASLDRQRPPTERSAPALPLLLRTFRLPSLSSDLDAAGVDVIGSDIAGRLGYLLEAQYSWGAQAANLDASLSLGLLPWTLGAELADRFSPLSGGDYTRRSSAELSLSREWELLPTWRVLSLGARASAVALAPLSGASAYAAPYASEGLATGLDLRYDAHRGAYFPPFVDPGWGAELAVDGDWDLAAAAARPAFATTAEFDATLPFLGASLLSWLALSPDGGLDFGPRSIERSGGGGSALEPRYPSYREYGDSSASGPWYAYGELSCLFANLELQRQPLGGPLYFRRARLTGGLRGAAIGGAATTLLSSAFGRLSLEGSPLVGMAVEARLTAAVELAYAFQAQGGSAPLHLSFLFGASL